MMDTKNDRGRRLQQIEMRSVVDVESSNKHQLIEKHMYDGSVAMAVADARCEAALTRRGPGSRRCCPAGRTEK